MSEADAPITESRSSTEIAQNSKHEPLVKVKCYAIDASEEAARDANALTIEMYKATIAAVGA